VEKGLKGDSLKGGGKAHGRVKKKGPGSTLGGKKGVLQKLGRGLNHPRSQPQQGKRKRKKERCQKEGRKIGKKK